MLHKTCHSVAKTEYKFLVGTSKGRRLFLSKEFFSGSIIPGLEKVLHTCTEQARGIEL